MSDHTTRDDALVERVQAAIGDYVQSVDVAEGYENTQRIIALVREDERARLRGALLGERPESDEQR